MPPASRRLVRGLRQLLLLHPVRFAVAALRYLWYAKLLRRLRIHTAAGPAVAPYTVSHNLKGLSDLAVARSTRLVRPLSCVESLDPEARILCVGPRTEGELLNLIGHGYAPAGIRGLDLISYSPWVDLGDMHAMPYADDSWDAVLLGWVLAYSEQPARAAREVLRVTRKGGVVAAGVEYNPASEAEIVERLGYRPGAAARITGVDALLGLFEGHVDRVYFSHEPVPERRDRIGAVSAVFSIRK